MLWRAETLYREGVDTNMGAYFEIPVVDMDRAITFYETLLGVEFERGAIHGYEMAFFPHEPNGTGISGALAKGDVYKPSIDGVFLYLRTESIDEVLVRSIELGSQVLLEKTVAPSCLVAEIMDSEGNRVCFMQDI
jgi:predicted enzyme related to lactoylglutathione lyase